MQVIARSPVVVAGPSTARMLSHLAVATVTPMALKDLVTLPFRVGVAATQVTLALGQLVARGDTLERIAPRLAEPGVVIPELHRSVDTLSEAIGPLSELAGRLPRTRRRAAAEA